MSGTSSFIIHLHNTDRPHYNLTLEQDGDKSSWVLPNGIPESLNEQKIAIEEHREGLDLSNKKGPSAKDCYGNGELKRWDEGSLDIETRNKIKYIFFVKGKRIKGKYLLHNPGWGRWTKKKLWVLEKVPEK